MSDPTPRKAIQSKKPKIETPAEKAPSSLGRLLSEISWEGNARHYRQGGRGLENVLTTEVFQAFDFLPRSAFFGRIFRAANGAAAETREILASQIEEAVIELLPGDLYLSRGGSASGSLLSLQPDAIIQTSDVYCLLEAKRIKSGSFQPEQLAREYLTVLREAKGRCPLLVLVLPKEPPVLVRGHGRLSIEDAIARWIDPILPHLEPEFPSAEELIQQIGSVVTYVTWDTVSTCLKTGLEELDCPDPSIVNSVSRLANSAIRAIEWHS